MRRPEGFNNAKQATQATAAALCLMLGATLLAPLPRAHAALPAVSGFAASSAIQSPGTPPRFAEQHAGQPYLGVDVRDLSGPELPQLHLRDTHGAEIIHVDHDGPAGKMGLREHDVILQMNGVLIEGQEQIRRMLRLLSPGNPVVLVISRDGQQMTLSTTVADRGEVERDAWSQHLVAPAAQAPASAMPLGEGRAFTSDSSDPAPTTRYSKGFLGTLLMSPSYTGAMLEIMGPQLAEFFGVPGGSGLLVRSVADNSPAARAGLRAGDIVLRANNRSMGTLSDWAKQIRKAKGHDVSVVVLRGHDQKTLTLTPDGKRRSSLSLPDQSVSAVTWAWARISNF